MKKQDSVDTAGILGVFNLNQISNTYEPSDDETI